MGRLNFGGRQDLSGVFSDLLRSYQADVEADVAAGKRRADEERAAEDAEMYAKWKAGEISDEAWLAHLAGRVDSSLEPKERSQYEELLLEHTGAIQDADAEARFAMGEISLAGLLQHYQSRMSSVEKNSPAWREMAARYGQLQGALAGGGGGSGGGGGYRSRGGGGGRSSGGGSGGGGDDIAPDDLDAAREEAFRDIGLSEGYDLDAYEDVIGGQSEFEDYDEYVDYLKGIIRTIEGINATVKENPHMKEVSYGGVTYEVNPDFLRALDNQYVQAEQELAAIFTVRGEHEDSANAVKYARQYIATDMQQHNSRPFSEWINDYEQLVFAEMAEISSIADPEARRRRYGEMRGEMEETILAELKRANPDFKPRAGMSAGEAIDAFASSLSPELRPDKDLFNRILNTHDVLFLGENFHRMTEEERNEFANEILTREGQMGEGGATVSIKGLLEGASEEGSTDFPPGFVGVLQNGTQELGLAFGELVMQGMTEEQASEELGGYDGPMYTFEYDGTATRVVDADLREKMNLAGGSSPILVPAGADPDQAVMSRVRVGGKTQTVWVAPQPVDDPRYRVYRDRDGNLIPSDELSDLTRPELATLIRRGEIEVDSVIQAVQLPDKSVWYRDTQTGLFYSEPPVVTETDPVTGGVKVNGDGEPVLAPVAHAAGVFTPFGEGVRETEMSTWTRQAIALGWINPDDFMKYGPGGDLEEFAGDEEWMYTSKVERGPRVVNQRIQDRLREKARSDADEFERSVQYARHLNAPTTQEEANTRAQDRARRAAEALGVRLGNEREVPDNVSAAGMDPKFRSPLGAPAQPVDMSVGRANTTFLGVDWRTARLDVEEARANRSGGRSAGGSFAPLKYAPPEMPAPKVQPAPMPPRVQPVPLTPMPRGISSKAPSVRTIFDPRQDRTTRRTTTRKTSSRNPEAI